MNRRKFLANTVVGGLLGTTLGASAQVGRGRQTTCWRRVCTVTCTSVKSCRKLQRPVLRQLISGRKKHGNQREQLTDLGEELFSSLLRKHDVQLGCMTQYPLGPFRLTDEMHLAKRLGCQTIVTGGEGPKGLSGADLKAAVSGFVEKMKPHLDVAEETNVTIAIENHASNLLKRLTH